MKKVMLILMLCLVCFAFPVVKSQDMPGIEVIAGSVIEADGSKSLDLPSEIGGIISDFTIETTQILELLGVAFHTEFTIESIEVFEIFAFSEGTTPDFDKIAYGDIFEESESIILPGRTTTENIWETTHVYSSWTNGIDHQSPFGLLEWIVTESGTFQITSITDTEVFFEHGSQGVYSELIEVCDETCPTELDLQFLGLVFGIDYDEVKYARHDYTSTIENVLILYLDNIFIGALADLNIDGLWTFTEEDFIVGKSTHAWESNTLLLSEPRIFDVWIVS